MRPAVAVDEGKPVAGEFISVSAAFEGNEGIGAARDLGREFVADLRSVHGMPVSGQVMDTVQLVVSELVTNVRKYAPGPCLLTLEVQDGAIEVSVWDSSTALPVTVPPDPHRIGRHGLEIVMAVSQSFVVRREPVGKKITAAITLAEAEAADEE
ncbi:ATP-binding protein [Streptomyces sp. p1417]|uniref:ATP-binding protein n=1 Tax=Streptomyces typhae TaxID=2681492 RepID=A0A6L6X3X6_9ACTN|nr:ATP-binding protein [Streptomyces typhae]